MGLVATTHDWQASIKDEAVLNDILQTVPKIKNAFPEFPDPVETNLMIAAHF